MTSRDVLSLCFDDEKVSLLRARRAGSLAAVARTVHAALVQRMKAASGEDAANARRWVDEAVVAHGPQASELDVQGLLTDAREAAKLVPLIEATQSWLTNGAGDLVSLDEVYRTREETQKPGRALLARSGDDRRAFASAVRAMAHPSLLDSTMTGTALSRGSKTRSQEQ